MEACENKWYSKGFFDAENFAELVVRQARKLRFEEGWLAMLQAMGVPKDSLLRNATAQNPFGVVDEEETPSMRELVQAIDSHMELVDLEVTGNLHASDQPDENVQL